MMDFMISNSPNQKREKIYAVAANGCVTQDNVSESFKYKIPFIWMINDFFLTP